MLKSKPLVVITTGGTGGHIFPALALEQELLQHGYDVIVTADMKFAKYHEFDQKHIYIPAASLNNKSHVIKNLWILTKGFLKALWLIFKVKPEFIIGFGGYASYPTALAAIFLAKTLIIHEANTVIGKANRSLLWYAKYLTIGFPTINGVDLKYKNKIVYTGNPVRSEIITVATKQNKAAKQDQLNIVIVGGSQGAKIFSKIIPDALVNLPSEIRSKLFIYQQVKEEDIDLISERYKKAKISYILKGFFDDMEEKLSNADFVIARAGASTIAELITMALPAILIPFPSSADKHQYYNALAVEEIGGGWLVIEDQHTNEKIRKIIKSINVQPTILTQSSEALKAHQCDGSKNIVRLLTSN